MNIIGIVGAGVIGSSVALDLALKGFKVILNDKEENKLDQSKKYIRDGHRMLHFMQKGHSIRNLEETLESISFSLNKEDLKPCLVVIENATESQIVKADIYSVLSECVPEAYLVVNTSCIPITTIASQVKDPRKVIGVHFMNPVPLKKYVEVARGYHTSDETFSVISELLKEMGKIAIVVQDSPGFVSNRISHLFMNEAAFLVYEGISAPHDVDLIFKQCYGHKMGPLETADLIGIDTVVHSLKVLFEEYQDSKFRCCPILKKMVSAGLLGRKSGEGFYKY